MRRRNSRDELIDLTESSSAPSYDEASDSSAADLGPDDAPAPSEIAARGGPVPAATPGGGPPKAARPSPKPKPKPKPKPAPSPTQREWAGEMPPLMLDEAAWREALDAGIEIVEDEDEVIELD